MTASWIVFSLTLVLAGCNSQLIVRDKGPGHLPLGLYQVVSRDCSYPPDVPEDCSKTQYLEIEKGVLSLDKDEVGLTTWLSDTPEDEHTFNLRSLHKGELVSLREYIIEDDPSGKEWFVLNDGVITDYFFIRHQRPFPEIDMYGKTHLTLRRITRTAEIDSLLSYRYMEKASPIGH